MTQITESAVKDIKISTVTVFYIFRKLEEKFNVLIRGMEDIKRTQSKPPEMRL